MTLKFLEILIRFCWTKNPKKSQIWCYSTFTTSKWLTKTFLGSSENSTKKRRQLNFHKYWQTEGQVTTKETRPLTVADFAQQVNQFITVRMSRSRASWMRWITPIRENIKVGSDLGLAFTAARNRDLAHRPFTLRNTIRGLVTRSQRLTHNPTCARLTLLANGCVRDSTKKLIMTMCL
jgi:hypothetical protein